MNAAVAVVNPGVNAMTTEERMRTVFTGWRNVTPGKCYECGSDDSWQVDGRGNIMCECHACPVCGIVDAYGFHEPGCGMLEDES